MNKTLIILFLLLYIPYGWSTTETRPAYTFHHAGGDEGLSHNNVKAIVKDRQGFVWIGTKNGLNRFDGRDMKQVECRDRVSGHANQNISALAEDHEGKLWIGTDKGVFIHDMEQETFRHVSSSGQDGTVMENWVAQIVCDNKGSMWIAIPNQGIFRYDNDHLTHYSLKGNHNTAEASPSGLAITPTGDLWVATWNKGLFRHDKQNDRFVTVEHDSQGKALTGLPMNCICPHDDGLVLALQNGRLMRYIPEEDRLTEIEFGNDKHSIVRTVMSAGGRIWAGTYDGLFIIDEKGQNISHLKNDRTDRSSLSDNIIYSMYEDKDGDVWIGTMFGGVNLCPQGGIKFRNMSCGLTSERLRGMAMDGKGNLYVGTEDAGMNIIDVNTGRIRQTGNPNGTVFSISTHEDKVYVGMFNEGLMVVDAREHTRQISPNELGTEDTSVFAFLIDNEGNKWIGTGSGLYMATPGELQSGKISTTGRAWIHDIFQDKDGGLWVASMGGGLWRREPKTGCWKHYDMEREDGTGSNSVNSVMQDSKGRIWISTDGAGICRYEPEKDGFTAYSISQELPDNVAYSILEDNGGCLWFGTNKGLVRFNPEQTGDIQIFTTRNGLPGNQFNYKTAVKAPDGTLYFGGTGGLVAFNPGDTTTVPKKAMPLYITNFSIYGEDITPNTPHSPLKRSIIHTDRIVLDHDQSNFSFDMAMLNYSEAAGIRYSYRLEPLDKQWSKAAEGKNISYAKLPPGTYTLHIRAVDPHGMTAERALGITVLPPWYLSVWAFFVYAALFITSILSWFRWYRSHKEAQLAERQKFFEMQKEKELYMAKTEFFTEIAHEIRTPLTLINGPLENIKEMDLHDEQLDNNIRIMDKNTKRLLDLSTGLLDFQKLETHRVNLRYEETDIAGLLRETCERFAPTFLRERKQLETDITETEVPAYVDKEAVTKIISNLLSNALKYAHHNISVSLIQEDENFIIKVKSDGDKIPEVDRKRIFDPFFRMESNRNMAMGTGIGLPLARSLATLHHGRLYLDESEKEYNTFILSVPIHEQEENRKDETQVHIATRPDNGFIRDEAEDGNIDTHSHVVLIVEDNEEMMKFLSGKIEEQFDVRKAENGKEALEILKSERIDLIVSDVMMPVMDGYELCRTVKSDMEICHIPIIFLTAKGDMDSKINGLKYGAEAYVEKPFSYKFLKAQMITLLANRQKEREAFARHPFLPNKEGDTSMADKEFMDKVMQIFNENLTDENLNVERIADILCMSRSGLYRKIKTLTGFSPVEFLRIIRLKKAAELILTGKYRINEICFMVGINAPSYFSKTFQKQFGMTPKEFERQNLKK